MKMGLKLENRLRSLIIIFFGVMSVVLLEDATLLIFAILCSNDLWFA